MSIHGHIVLPYVYWALSESEFLVLWGDVLEHDKKHCVVTPNLQVRSGVISPVILGLHLEQIATKLIFGGIVSTHALEQQKQVLKNLGGGSVFN